VFFSIEVKFARNAKRRARNQFEANVWGTEIARKNMLYLVRSPDFHLALGELKRAEMEEASVNRVSGNQCAQCRADIIAPEWAEHLSDHCVRNVWCCEACGYRFEDAVYLSRELAEAD
jgi:uncharacterized protein with GYD domain